MANDREMVLTGVKGTRAQGGSFSGGGWTFAGPWWLIVIAQDIVRNGRVHCQRQSKLAEARSAGGLGQELWGKSRLQTRRWKADSEEYGSR